MMTNPFRVSLLVAVFGMVTGLVLAEPAEARRVDVEIGGGAAITVDSDLDDVVENGGQVVLAAAVELGQRWDLEILTGWAGLDDETDGSSEDVYQAGIGLRHYLNADPEKTGRFFVSGGYAYFDGFLPDDDSNMFYIGPGVRLLAGERSGIVAKGTFYIRSNDGDSLLMPTIAFFYSWP